MAKKCNSIGPRWGIASAGKISHDFVNALSTYGPDSGHEVVAVAARSLEAAKEFAEKHNIPKAYEGEHCHRHFK